MSKGTLAVISGFSGAGKGTIVNELMNRYDDYALSISATTRKPRTGEQDGREYFFISKDEFEKRISEGRFLEYARYVDNYYGTPRDYVLSKLDEGKHVILEIEMQGGLQVKERYPDARLIFITVDNFDTLKGRLQHRGTETDEQINKRIERAKQEVDFMKRYDFIVENDNLDETVNKVNDYIRR